MHSSRRDRVSHAIHEEKTFEIIRLLLFVKQHMGLLIAVLLLLGQFSHFAARFAIIGLLIFEICVISLFLPVFLPVMFLRVWCVCVLHLATRNTCAPMQHVRRVGIAEDFSP